MEEMIRFSKNIITTITLLITFNCLALASETTQVQILNAQEKTFQLSINNQGQENVKILLRDQEYKVFFTEKLDSNKELTRKYGLSNLPNGEYIFEVENNTFFLQQKITIKAKEMMLGKRQEKKFFQPFFQQKENVVNINFLTLDFAKVTVNILNENDEIIFTDNEKDVQTFHKSYGFENLPNGTYTINVSAKGKSYRTSVLVRENTLILD